MPHREECEKLRLPCSLQCEERGLAAPHRAGRCAARGGSRCWPVQPGFPRALVPSQLALLWQQIPLLSG